MEWWDFAPKILTAIELAFNATPSARTSSFHECTSENNKGYPIVISFFGKSHYAIGSDYCFSNLRLNKKHWEWQSIYWTQEMLLSLVPNISWSSYARIQYSEDTFCSRSLLHRITVFFKSSFANESTRLLTFCSLVLWRVFEDTLDPYRCCSISYIRMLSTCRPSA